MENESPFYDAVRNLALAKLYANSTGNTEMEKGVDDAFRILAILVVLGLVAFFVFAFVII